MAKLKWDPALPGVRWNRLKVLRKSRGLSQPQVAVGAGVSITTIYFLELGYELRTTLRTKKKIAAFFQVGVDDLFPCEMVGDKPRQEFDEKLTSGTGQALTK